ncbi:MAG: S8 family serine peptidase [Bacteroidota bacterium]
MKRVMIFFTGILLLMSQLVNAQDCPLNLVVTTDYPSGSQVVREARSTISATNKIFNGAVVTYDAGVEINLLPGFDAEDGSQFSTALIGCENTNEPDDTYFPLQWGHLDEIDSLKDINGGDIEDPGRGANVLGAWRISQKTESSITVAILDSGLDIEHPDLDQSRVVHGYNYLRNTSDYDDTFGHGSLVAGVLGGKPNDSGVVGVDILCNIMPLVVTGRADDDNVGGITAIDSAVRHAVRNNADIITQSFGYSDRPVFPGSEQQLRSLEDAYREAIDSGLLIFAAVGNDNRDSADYPAKLPSIVGVGALSPCDERKRSVNDSNSGSCDRDDREDLGIDHWGSNFGKGLDFLAPGTLLPSTDALGAEGYSAFGIYNVAENGDYILDAYGTSMSSPFAAGIASLVWNENRQLKNYQVLHILRETARDISPNPDPWDPETGYGALNAAAAVAMAKNFNPQTDFLLADLVFEMVDIPEVADLNSELIIQFRIKNSGDAQSGLTSAHYEISSGDNIYLTNDVVIPPLDSEESSNIYSINLTLAELSLCEDGQFLEGDYEVEFNIDPDNLVEEFNEFNKFFEQFEVKELDLADLEVQNMSLGKKANNYEISFDILNKGEANFSYIVGGPTSQPQAFFKYYGSTDNILDEKGDQLLLTRPLSESLTLCIDESESRGARIPVNSVEQSANYILVKVDSNGSGIVPESNENNNVGSVLLPINAAELSKRGTEVVGKTGFSDQNYVLSPNPLVDEGMLRISLKKESTVSLSVVNLTGQDFSKTVFAAGLPSAINQAGIHEIPISRKGMTSGIYLLKIIIDGEQHIQRLVIK